jgi:ribosomal protein S11
MKRKNRKHISYDKKTQKSHKGKPLSAAFYAKTLVKKRWKIRKKTFSPYPYLMTISYYKTNVFFTVADIHGHTKVWTSTGRSGFKNKDKTTYMAIVRAMELFLKKIWNGGIRCMLLQFRNLYRRHARFAIRFSLRKFKQRYRFQYLGLLVENQMAFNGCRKKKKRRK